MPVSAHDIAAVLRERQPGLPVEKLHKLLYYCQGHHLATFGEPLFREGIAAWDIGPVVAALWRHEKRGESSPPRAELTEAELNTVGYVLSRYSALTSRDLETLTLGEPPWLNADSRRPAGQSTRIELEWMRTYFRGQGAPEGLHDVPLDAAMVAEWLSGAEQRRSGSARPDSREELRRRLSAGA